jgi:hypothetical protein
MQEDHACRNLAGGDKLERHVCNREVEVLRNDFISRIRNRVIQEGKDHQSDNQQNPEHGVEQKAPGLIDKCYERLISRCCPRSKRDSHGIKCPHHRVIILL